MFHNQAIQIFTFYKKKNGHDLSGWLVRLTSRNTPPNTHLLVTTMKLKDKDTIEPPTGNEYDETERVHHWHATKTRKTRHEKTRPDNTHVDRLPNGADIVFEFCRSLGLIQPKGQRKENNQNEYDTNTACHSTQGSGTQLIDGWIVLADKIETLCGLRMQNVK